MDPCLFLLKHLFCLSHCKIRWTMSVDNVGLKIQLLGTSNSMVTLTFFLGVKWSGPRTSSTINHIFYRTLGWLLDPWHKQPLIIHIILAVEYSRQLFHLISNSGSRKLSFQSLQIGVEMQKLWEVITKIIFLHKHSYMPHHNRVDYRTWKGGHIWSTGETDTIVTRVC